MKHDAFILFSKRHLFLTTKCIQAIITSYKTCTLNKTRKKYPILQGVPEKMFLSEKGTLLAKEHFFGTPGIPYSPKIKTADNKF